MVLCQKNVLTPKREERNYLVHMDCNIIPSVDHCMKSVLHGITFDGVLKFAMVDDASVGICKGDVVNKFCTSSTLVGCGRTNCCAQDSSYTSSSSQNASSKRLENAYITLMHCIFHK